MIWMKKWHLFKVSALTLALLAGCGDGGSNAADAGSANAQTDGGQASQARGGPGGGFGMTDENGNPADLIGKIKSINGNTITVYKSRLDPSQTGRGGGRSGRQAPSGEGQTQAGDGQTPSGEGQAQAGDGQTQNGGGQAQTGDAPPTGGDGTGRPQGSTNMADRFTDETVDITVTDSTKIRKIAFENNERTTSEAALSDLKAGEVLTIWLNEGTQEASLITIGGMGGGFGRGSNEPGASSAPGQQAADQAGTGRDRTTTGQETSSQQAAG
jgi:hypothetical protein